MNIFSNFIKDDSGATLIEYALLAGLIAVVAIGAISALGGKVNTVFTTIDGKLDAAAGAGDNSGAAPSN